jgi:hypothetical protein
MALVLGIIPIAQRDSKQDSTVLTQDYRSRVPTPGPRQTEQAWAAVDHGTIDTGYCVARSCPNEQVVELENVQM